jgi:hypothetical protein
MEAAIQITGLSLFWNMQELSPDEPDAESVARLREKRDAFLCILDAISARQGNSDDENVNNSVRRTVCRSLALVRWCLLFLVLHDI